MDFIFYAVYLTLTTINYVHTAQIKDRSTCTKYPCLIFNDEFNKLDHSVWEHMISRFATGNDEFQYYTNNRSNSFIRDGVLYLKPTLTRDTWDDDFLTSATRSSTTVSVVFQRMHIENGTTFMTFKVNKTTKNAALVNHFYQRTMDLWGSSQATYCTSNRYNEGCFGQGSPDNILNPIQSASIRTERSFSFKYGRMEVKARLPRGDWIWPAVWLMPRYDVYGGWPASGEIDLLESRGNDELYSGEDKDKDHVGNKMISQSLHWGPYFPLDGHVKTLAHVIKKSGRYSDGYHIYGMEWEPGLIRFTIDNKTSLNITIDKKSFWEWGEFSNVSKNLHNPWEGGTKMAPFDEEFYIIMNVAVGGTNNFFHDAFHPKPPWKNDGDDGKKAVKDFWEARKKWLPTWKGDETAMKVDYVKVWATKPT